VIEVYIMTPKGLYKQTKASIINIVTSEGQRGLLPRHMPIVCALEISQMSMEEESGRETYTISGGTLYLRDDVCRILTPSIENVKDIDVERAKSAKERAEKLIEDNDSNLDLKRAQLALARALNRLEASEKK